MSYMHSNYNPKKHSIFIPKNKKKYIGKQWPIARSGLEYKYMEMLDTDSKVIQWSSESFYIPYMLQRKRKHYFPDFYVRIKDPLIGEETSIIELKPFKETIPPTPGKNKSRKTKLYENFTWKKNQAKWKAARNYCNKMGWKFKIITEKDIFHKH